MSIYSCVGQMPSGIISIDNNYRIDRPAQQTNAAGNNGVAGNCVLPCNSGGRTRTVRVTEDPSFLYASYG